MKDSGLLRSGARRWPMRVYIACLALLSVGNCLRVFVDVTSGPELRAVLTSAHRMELIRLYGPEPAALLAVLPPALVAEAMLMMWCVLFFPLVHAFDSSMSAPTFSGRARARSTRLRHCLRTSARLAGTMVAFGAVVHAFAFLHLHEAPRAVTLRLLLAPVWLAPFAAAIAFLVRAFTQRTWSRALLALLLVLGFVIGGESKTCGAFWPTAQGALLLCGSWTELARAVLVVVGWASAMIAALSLAPLLVQRLRRSKSSLESSKLGIEKC